MPLHEVSFERDGHIYLIAPLAPVVPTREEFATYEFAREANAIIDQAPNPNLAWYRGRYVEADKPNANGALWLNDELAIASVTPMLMPVTVMHDPATAVGLIADTKLVARDEAGGIPRARIDNVIALWKHRFPEIAEEATANYQAGTLMQSMECRMSHYDCSECGKGFVKLPGGAEQANWCTHLRGEEGRNSSRILRGVCFTGTGLIFGTQGAKGAYDEAHLEPLMDEVAEFHERTRNPKPRTSTKPRRTTMEVDDKTYAELVAAQERLKAVEPELATAKAEAEKVPQLTKDLEQAEIDKKAAETARDEEKGKREKLEETASQVTLSTERVGKLGSKFLAALPETVKGRLDEQAKTMSDEDWKARVDELAEMVNVKPDEQAAEGEQETFSTEEVARSRVAGGKDKGGNGSEPSAERRHSVVAGLLAPDESTKAA